MSAIVVIPARYDSTRFPGKPLALLKGIPVIQHVYQNSSGSRLADDVIIATDNKTVLQKVLSFGGKAVMTSGNHISGTDRIAEVARSLDYDIIVNVQGDEPLIKPEMIDDVITVLTDNMASIGTLAKEIRDKKEIFNPNIVKVVFDRDGFAFYFSRAPIPYHRDEFLSCFKHIGIYSYRRDILLRLTELPQSPLEKAEKLEQLRALENGYKIKVKETSLETFGVDTPDDLERIERCLNSSL